MLFSSIPFLYYFLPGVLILYFLSPKCMKNTVLLFSSLIFYAWGEPKYVLIMLASIIIGFFSGLLIEAFRGKKKMKLICSLAVMIELGILVYFKYANFFLENFSVVTGLSVSLLKLTLPVGISFYTFQVLSYVIDVYRGEVKAQRNIISLATYVAMFPQLVAGPIVRYSDMNMELKERRGSTENFALGVRRFVLGLSKKVLIANVLGELCDKLKASDDKSVLLLWLYGIAFMLHIYFDFSGYSDMAIGLGRILGFHFSENFNYPYISRSVTEFWRRWHISLGSWFKDYVYIPLGGNRVSKVRWLFNLFVVWMLTGLWHGAAWNFMIWGLFFAVLLIIEKTWLLKYLEKSRVLGHFYVLGAVMLSFVIFDAADMRQALIYIGGMFGLGRLPFMSREFTYYLKSYGTVLVLGMLGATPVLRKLVVKAAKVGAGEKILGVFEPLMLVGLMLLVTAYLVDGSFNPFLYFRF